jgi:hypothetical protein
MRAGLASRRLLVAATAAALIGAAPLAEARTRVPSTWPFAPLAKLRAPRARDALPSLYAGPCSTGCRAPGAMPGWPVKPFHRGHLLRAGLNELRPANLHIGVDILARDGTPVYAIQPGRAHVIERSGRDARVQVGSFQYWHIRPRVAEGQAIRPYREVLGTVVRGASHVHLSEVRGGSYLNPLRPGGRVLAPWRDTGVPALSRPRLLRRGRVLIQGFDPQASRRARRPVLALAGLAYRLFDRLGRRVGPLRWALRGARHQPNSLRRRIYARGSHLAFATCVMRRHPCRPRWIYRLAGGLAPRLRVRQGRVYTLTAYAWDWAGHVRALDTRFVYVRGEPFVSPGG